MSGVGTLIGVGTTAALVGIGGAALTSWIAQNAAADADKANRKELGKAQKAVDEATAKSQAGLDPYNEAGQGALQQQQALLGLLGPEAQQQAIAAVQASPQFGAMQQAGEDAILANASATGGLRGGNTQQALASNSQNILAQLIQQQYANLGGLAGNGQQAASQQGAFGMQGAGATADIYGQIGASRAGAVLGKAQAQVNGINSVTNSLGTILGASPTGGL